MYITKKKWTLILLPLLVFLLAGTLAAQTEEDSEKDVFDMSFNELMTVKITTAGKMVEEIGNIPASVVIISRKEIELHGYMNLTEILQNIRGLYGIGDSNNLHFGVRGFYSEGTNMIILVDGVTQLSAVNSDFTMADIVVPVEAIDRIEVVRGPMSVMYGSGAFFGVINIITNRVAEDGPNSFVTASYGSNETRKIFARFAGQIGDFNYVFNGSIYDSYGMDVPYSTMMSQPSTLADFGLAENATTGGSLEKEYKYFNFSGKFRNFYVNLQYGEAENELFAFLPAYPPGNLWNPVHSRIFFGYKKKVSKLYTFDGKFTFFRNRIWMDFKWFSPDAYANQQTDSNTVEVDLINHFNISPKLNITAGLYYRSIMDAYLMANWPALGAGGLRNSMFKATENINTMAMYTQVNYEPFSHFNLVGGVRLEKMQKYPVEGTINYDTPDFILNGGEYDHDKLEVIPRFAAIYNHNNRHIVKLLYGKAVNRPSFFHIFQNKLLSPGIYQLEPEYINTLELNVMTYLSPKLILNTSLFRNTLSNLITREVEIADDGTFQSHERNAGRLVTTGVEFTLQAKPFKDLILEFSGTYQETADKREGLGSINVGYSPKFLGYIKGSFRFNKDLCLALTGRYIDEIETFYDNTHVNPDGSFGIRLGDKVPGYFILDANLRVEELFGTDIFLNFRCSNLFDQEIRYPVLPQNTWADRGTVDLRRTFLITAGLRF